MSLRTPETNLSNLPRSAAACQPRTVDFIGSFLSGLRSGLPECLPSAFCRADHIDYSVVAAPFTLPHINHAQQNTGAVSNSLKIILRFIQPFRNRCSRMLPRRSNPEAIWWLNC